MTRTIYLKFQCGHCGNRWTSIAGTFQVSFKYHHERQLLIFWMMIYGEQCIHCKKLAKPMVYKTQMEAMKIFFSTIVVNIVEGVPPPKKPEKYYIRRIHDHKSELC